MMSLLFVVLCFALSFCILIAIAYERSYLLVCLIIMFIMFIIGVEMVLKDEIFKDEMPIRYITVKHLKQIIRDMNDNKEGSKK